MNIFIIAIIAILLILVLFVISTYNALVNARLKTQNSWSQIDTQLKRRYDLIPNLVETVKGYAKHEEATLEGVISARNAYGSANTIEEKAEAANMLTGTLKTLFSVTESYPELKANEGFLSLQQDLKDTEDKIAFARQFYNDTVELYNGKLLVFPNNIIASMFNFKAAAFFEIAEEQKENVKVQF